MYVCMYVHMYVRMYVCMHACVYVCVYICEYVCVDVCVFVCVCMHTGLLLRSPILCQMLWRGGGLGSSTISKNLMNPPPRRKWYLTTGRRAHKMVLDPIPLSLPVHFFGCRPQPPTSHAMYIRCMNLYMNLCMYVCIHVYIFNMYVCMYIDLLLRLLPLFCPML